MRFTYRTVLHSLQFRFVYKIKLYRNGNSFTPVDAVTGLKSPQVLTSPEVIDQAFPTQQV